MSDIPVLDFDAIIIGGGGPVAVFNTKNRIVLGVDLADGSIQVKIDAES